MSKNAWLLVAFIAVLLVCGWPLMTHQWFAPHPTVSGRRAASSSSPMATSVVPNASPLPERADADTAEAGPERQRTEGRPFEQRNAALETARQKAAADEKRAEQKTEMLAALSGKLLDASLKVPQTAPEAASLMGQNLVANANFRRRWGDSVPAAGTPEADEYAREQDDLLTQTAALLKFMTDENKSIPLAQPDGLARFQAASLASALGLRDDQAQGVNTSLDGYYQQFFAQGLSMNAARQTGPEATRQWIQQRSALSEQAYAAVAALLTPEQAAAFHSLYPAARKYLTEIDMGGNMQVTR